MVLAGEVDLDGTPGGPSAEDMLAQQAYVKQQADMEAYQRELEREARREAREMRRLEREVRQQQQQLDAGAAPEPLARVSAASGGALTAGPALEVTVMRVVGCDLLTGARTGRDFTVITYAGSRPSEQESDSFQRLRVWPAGHQCQQLHGSGPALLASHAWLYVLAHPLLSFALPFFSQAPPAAPTPRSAATATRTTSRWCACLARAASSRPSPLNCTWTGIARRWARCRWRSCTR